MGLDVPDLDDRTYEEFREDARKRIPIHAEEWTDHNVHDPGITILELLAFLAETHTFQLDQISDAHRRKYLELVDVEPRPPQQASVDLSLSVADATDGQDTDAANSGDLAPGTGTTVPAGTAVVAETEAGRRERFRTTERVACSATRLAAVVVETETGRTEHTRANDTDGLHYRAFGEDPAVGDALYLGFDGDPFESATLDLWVDFHDANLPAPATHGDEPVDFEPSLRCVWEHCLSPEDWYFDHTWDPIETTRDDTNALYRGGRITLQSPTDWQGARVPMVDHDAERYWIRCRLAPPEDGDREDVRYEVPPQVDEIDVNVVPARHERVIEDESVETLQDATTAEPNQTFELDERPVQSATVHVGGEVWETVTDFDQSTGDDRHVRLDRAAGRLTFGDGRRGAIPEPWQEIDVDYVAGGGPAGNLPAGAAWRFDDPPFEHELSVAPKGAPSGGREAESIEAALARAREQQKVPFRAVTAEDHATIAAHTPGLRVGRAAVASAPGGREPVTVVVVPASPGGRLPVPSQGFQAAVEAHLCEHALLTERVAVVGPTYVPVEVTVELEPAPGADRTTVAQAARDRVETFLDPLEGFDGDGWPFGRAVYHSELYEQLEGLDRVADAVDVGVSTGGEVPLADGQDTLPNLTAVRVDVIEPDEHCGRGA